MRNHLQVPSKISINALKSLCVFAESASMAEAAEQLNLTQPALSKQLDKLAKSLPVPLFTQEGKRKKLTAYGESLVKSLRPRFDGLEDSLLQLNLDFQDVQNRQIRICARREILERICAIPSESQIQFIEASHSEVLQSLTQQQVEVGITHELPDSPELVAKELFRESFQLALPKALFPRELKWTDKYLSEELAQVPALAYRREDEILQAVTRSLNPGWRPSIHRISDNYRSLYLMTEKALGWSVLPDLPELKSSKIWSIPLPSRLISGREFHILYRKEHSRSRWLKDVLTQIQGTFKP